MGRYLDHNPKKVALVGMGPSIVDIMNETLTQECTPDWIDEVWTINMTANVIRSDVIIWMDDLEQQEQFKPGLMALLRKYRTPVITSVAKRHVVPNSYDYPVSEIAAQSVPYFGKPYLNNGVAMGIAYALYKGVKILKIYGCDFTYPNRNFAEEGRACCEAWIALASLCGMQVQLSPSTSLYDTCADHGIYGYAEQPEVELPDGTKFRYVKSEDATRGVYIPEDTSSSTSTGGINAQLDSPEPGTNVNPPVDGRDTTGTHTIAPDAPAPTG